METLDDKKFLLATEINLLRCASERCIEPLHAWLGRSGKVEIVKLVAYGVITVAEVERQREREREREREGEGERERQRERERERERAVASGEGGAALGV